MKVRLDFAAGKTLQTKVQGEVGFKGERCPKQQGKPEKERGIFAPE